jgi:DNA helicase-2/ATP-dependent DNA helicase PcrA
MEDGILTHERSLDHPDQLEEERRLVFVGITRGREEVHASSARIREYRGSCRVNPPSLFLAEMTGSETIVTGAEAPDDDAFSARMFAASADDFDDVGQEIDRGQAGRAVHRPDGLVLEMEDDAPPPPQPRRRVDAVIERATDLADRMAGRQPAAVAFVAGQRVSNASHGTGTITGISGSGPRAIATVVFDGPAGTRKFILGHGGLAPLE